jgi:hypothetical protein
MKSTACFVVEKLTTKVNLGSENECGQIRESVGRVLNTNGRFDYLNEKNVSGSDSAFAMSQTVLRFSRTMPMPKIKKIYDTFRVQGITQGSVFDPDSKNTFSP